MTGERPVGPETWDALMRPKGIAIVGVSERQRYSGALLGNLLGNGYPADRIHPVNPRYDQFMDLPCHASVADVPAPASLVIFLTRGDRVSDLLVEAGGVDGLDAAIVIADGFAEEGGEGRARQDELARISRDVGVPILGPNTLGFVSTEGRCAAWAGANLPPVPDGGVGLVFQSSGMLNLVLGLVAGRSIGISTAVSVGNEAVLDIADHVDHLVDDDRTRVIAVMMESCLRPRAVVDALARARDAGKPVVMLKVGVSERAQRNAIAHTGRLAGSGDAWEALLRQLGVVLVEDIDELLLAAALFARRGIEEVTPAVGLATISGGDCSLLGDLAHRLHLPLPEPTPSILDRMIDRTGKATLVGNPLDCEDLHRHEPETFTAVLNDFCSDPRTGIIAYRFNLSPSPTPPLIELYEQLVGAARAHGKLPVVLTRAGEFIDPAWFALFESLDVAFLPAYRPALSVLQRYCRWLGEREGIGGPFRGVPRRPLGTDPATVRTLSWVETQAFLERAGIPYAPSSLAADADQAVADADALGYPVAVKIASPGLAHKSDIGGVALGLTTADEVREACARFGRLVDEHAEGIDVEGYEVQAMAGDGVELILGAMSDSTLGPVVLVGLGGVLTEVLRDTRVIVPPINADEAEAVLRSLRGAALLDGVRGRAPVDVDALAGVVARLSTAVLDDVVVQELDLNPVIVRPGEAGVVAVDAIVRIAEDDPNGITT